MPEVKVNTPSVSRHIDHLKVATDPRASLINFSLDELAPYTHEGSFDPASDPRYRIFFVGRDDVHGIMCHLYSKVSSSFKFNQFGYDDEELDSIIQKLVANPLIYGQATLDKSQAGGVHEKKILAAWDKKAFSQSFVVGQSATHQISHTKGGVLDGKVAYEGSTNWSASGEGTFVLPDGPGGTGYKAQNNTLLVTTDPYFCQRFSTQLDIEHTTALQQQIKSPA